mgnify:CR=1 FL=1
MPLRQYPSVLKQVNFAKRISPQNAKAQEFYDYLLNPTADMMVVELEILGDPAYVAQDIFSPFDNQDGDGQTPLELKKAAQGGLDEILSEENLKKYYSKFFRT